MATVVYATGMAPSAQDSLQVLLIKAAYWAQTAAGAGPFPDGMYENMTPFPGDTTHDLTAKLAYWLMNVTGGGGGGGGILRFSTGSGSPEGSVSGSPGDTYWDTANDYYYVKVTGTATTTGWQSH